jgi:hypothetical protein
MRFVVAFSAFLFASAALAAETPVPLSIGELLAQGWEMGGFAAANDNRTSLLVFRKAGATSLVQCSTHYDPSRTPMTVINCYELH